MGGAPPDATRDRSDPRTANARRLRRDATPPERRLRTALRQLDLPHGHFRGQVPIGPYFADFAHHGLRLIIELDGEQHGYAAGQQRDAVRTAYLEKAGYRVMRFWNDEVRKNLDGVVETIPHRIAETAAIRGQALPDETVHHRIAAPPPTPNPSPPQTGGGGSEARRSKHFTDTLS